MTPRPARVAIVVDGGEHWDYWVRRALYRSGQIWGGAGFVVIPHRSGQVAPEMLRACAAYDPDFVVTCDPTVGELEQIYPGSFKIRGQEGELLTGPEREEMLRQAQDWPADLEPDQTAREQLAAICSPYRSRHSTTIHEDTTSLSQAPDRHFADAQAIHGEGWQVPVLSCPTDWGGPLGVAVASRTGMAERPERAIEPTVQSQVRDGLGHWLLDGPSARPPELLLHPQVAAGIGLAGLPTAFDRTLTGLTTVSSGFPVRQAGLLVIGDEPEDFALARTWRLTFGTGHWLPSALFVNDLELPWSLANAVQRIANGLRRQTHRLIVTSTSRAHHNLRAVSDGLKKPPIGNPIDNLDVLPPTELPWRQPMTTFLAVEDQFDTVVPVPTTVDHAGTRDMAAPLPTPVLTNPSLANQPEIDWQIDISWRPDQTVMGRGLVGNKLFTAEHSLPLTWARSSRTGITYQSGRFDFIPAGTRQENKLARPALRDLSLSRWIAAKAEEYDASISLSEAGRRTEMLANMVGGRSEFVQLFAGPMRNALLGMFPSEKSTRQAYPACDGVRIAANEGVLTFAGICSRTAQLGTSDARNLLDSALKSGVIRRGLVLRCETCEKVQFRNVDAIGQQWICARCDGVTQLSQNSWHLPPDEPKWFYDLHPVGRNMIVDHGDIPVLLSDHLRTYNDSNKETFQDAQELEFWHANKRVAEVDLVSYTEDIISIAECKSVNDLGNDGAAEVVKKCKIAAWLRADRLIFATTATSWKDRARNLIHSAVSSFSDWNDLGSPEVVLITELGTDSAYEEELGSFNPGPRGPDWR